MANPLLCARPVAAPGAEMMALQAALADLPQASEHAVLAGAIDCLIGDDESALANFRAGEGDAFFSAMQQYPILVKAGETAQALQELVDADIFNKEWDDAAQVLVYRNPQIDARMFLTTLANRYPSQKMTWIYWLKVGDRILQNDGWKAAITWYEKGLQFSSGYEGSLELRIGRILQTEATPRDMAAALDFYDQSIASGGKFLSDMDESNVHVFRGDIYRTLPKDFSPDQSIAEYDRAIFLNSGSYWGWLGKGIAYLINLHDPGKSESFFLQALSLNHSNPNAYYYLGEAARLQNDPESAIQFYQQALALKPDWQPPKDRLAELNAVKP